MSDFDYTQPHKIVNGTPVLLTSDEIAENAANDAAWLAAAPDRAKQAAARQITVLENQASMPRPVRDMLLASTTTNDAAKAKVQALSDQITQIAVSCGLRAS